MIQLSYCHYGNGLAISAAGPIDKVTQTFNRFANFGITNSEPIWLNEDKLRALAYILTDQKKLLDGFTAMKGAGLITRCLSKRTKSDRRDRRYKGQKKGVMPTARQRALESISKIPKGDFLEDTSSSVSSVSLLGEERGGFEE
jgi:hypothetical protein